MHFKTLINLRFYKHIINPINRIHQNININLDKNQMCCIDNELII